MGRVVLAWDAPNIAMTLATLLGHRPGSGDRPDMRSLIRWLAKQRAAGEELEATVFVNVPAERPQALLGWITFLQSIGFRVFARPRVGGSDIDEAMVEYLSQSATAASTLVVASNDASRFAEPVRKIAASGVRVIVLGFSELAGGLAEPDGWQFTDLEEVPDLLRMPLVRTRLDTLPIQGGWLEPSTSLEEALLEGATPEPDARGPEPDLRGKG